MVVTGDILYSFDRAHGLQLWHRRNRYALEGNPCRGWTNGDDWAIALSASASAPITAVSPLRETELPNRSCVAPSPARSLATSSAHSCARADHVHRTAIDIVMITTRLLISVAPLRWMFSIRYAESFIRYASRPDRRTTRLGTTAPFPLSCSPSRACSRRPCRRLCRCGRSHAFLRGARSRW